VRRAESRKQKQPLALLANCSGMPITTPMMAPKNTKLKQARLIWFKSGSYIV